MISNDTDSHLALFAIDSRASLLDVNGPTENQHRFFEVDAVLAEVQ